MDTPPDGMAFDAYMSQRRRVMTTASAIQRYGAMGLAALKEKP